MDQVIVEIQEDQSAQTTEVLQYRDGVVLEIEQTQSVLTLQNGAYQEVTAVQIETIWVTRSLLCSAKNNWDPRDQGGLGKDHTLSQLRGGVGSERFGPPVPRTRWVGLG